MLIINDGDKFAERRASSLRSVCSISVEKLQVRVLSECMHIYACCFLKNTMTYFNLFVCPVKLRDISVMTRVSNVILLF